VAGTPDPAVGDAEGFPTRPGLSSVNTGRLLASDSTAGPEVRHMAFDFARQSGSRERYVIRRVASGTVTLCPSGGRMPWKECLVMDERSGLSPPACPGREDGTPAPMLPSPTRIENPGLETINTTRLSWSNLRERVEPRAGGVWALDRRKLQRTTCREDPFHQRGKRTAINVNTRSQRSRLSAVPFRTWK
jgi:hypothetical protein